MLMSDWFSSGTQKNFLFRNHYSREVTRQLFSFYSPGEVYH